MPVRLFPNADSHCSFVNEPDDPQSGGRVPADTCRFWNGWSTKRRQCTKAQISCTALAQHIAAYHVSPHSMHHILQRPSPSPCNSL